MTAILRTRRIDERIKGLIFGLLLAGFVGSTAIAQDRSIRPNYRDADIRQIIEAVSEVTGKSFIIDPRINAKVTMISNTAMTPEAFYEAFLSILQVHAYIAVPAGDIIKIVPDANARQLPGNDLPSQTDGLDEIVTQVVQVTHVNAAQLVPILRPLIPQYGHLAAYPSSNMLIISDRAANVSRLVRIIRRIDQSGDDDIEVIPLEHASSGETVRVLASLQQGAVRPDTAGKPVTFVADARTNSILISGDRASRLRFRALIAHLDTPLEDGANTRVRYLRYAHAPELAEQLKEHVQQYLRPEVAGAVQSGTGAGQLPNIAIWGEEMTNALIVNAPPKVMREIMSIVDKLDIRRAQVAVQAIIVEVSADLAAEFGFSWAVFDPDTFAGISNFRTGGLGIADVIGAAIDGDLSSDDVNLVRDGLTTGGGYINEDGASWLVMLRAFAGDAHTNIISTPSIITMDNEEAEIKVAQEVPFLTGSFTNTGAAAGAVNPFQTIQREEVGTILKITPQINEGNSISLAIQQEQSSLAASSEGAVDLVTNKRTITTNVIVEDGGVVVLGGLIEDSLLESEGRVPILGSIPVLGQLFKTRRTDLVKTNLMVFIQVTILRNAEDTAIETNQKYQYMRDLQIPQQDEGVQLMPGQKRPILDATPGSTPAPTTGAAEKGTEENGE